MTGTLTLASDPLSNMEAATKQYVDNATPDLSGRLATTGGTMTGAIQMGAVATSSTVTWSNGTLTGPSRADFEVTNLFNNLGEEGGPFANGEQWGIAPNETGGSSATVTFALDNPIPLTATSTLELIAYYQKGHTVESGGSITFTSSNGDVLVPLTPNALNVLGKTVVNNPYALFGDQITAITIVSGPGDWTTLSGIILDGTRLVDGQTFTTSGGASSTIGVDGTATFSGNVTAATPTDPTHLTNKSYVDAQIASATPDLSSRLATTGGTMTGDLDMGSNKITYSNVYTTEAELPSATTYHGMFAHVHTTGAGYFAHAGNWIKLQNEGARVVLPSGSNGTPELTFAADSDTGIRCPAPGEVSVVCDGAQAAKINSAGVEAQNFNATSDITLKQDISIIDNAMEMIQNLEGINWSWKNNGKAAMGVSAQNVEEVAPQLVGNGEYKSVNYNGLVGILIEAVKSLKEEIDELKK